jgi:hypothetical protein
MGNEPKVKYDVKEPLLAFWMAISDNKDPEILNPYFELDIKSEAFKQVSIFSASIYLRQLFLKQPTLEISLPKTMARINKFQEIFQD